MGLQGVANELGLVAIDAFGKRALGGHGSGGRGRRLLGKHPERDTIREVD